MEKKGIAYVPPKNSRVKPNSKQTAIKPKALYSHFTYGHIHDYDVEKPWVKKNFGRTNKKEPKKIWLLKDIIIYIVDILSSQVKTPIIVLGLWMLTTYDWKRTYVLKSGT